MEPKDSSAEAQVRKFYDNVGWQNAETGSTQDACLWEDLRPSSARYVSRCRLRVLRHLPRKGDQLLDAASGPLQYPEYLEFSAGFTKRVCVDISKVALEEAARKLGPRGETVCASILELPFENDRFDAVVSLHTLYHIDEADQERAVRQLIRVARPDAPIVIVYSNPDRWSVRIRRLLGRPPEIEGPIYFHAYPLGWWRRFENEARVSLHPWRFLTAGESRSLVPSNSLGKLMLEVLFWFEGVFSRWAVRWGAYPMIILKKKC